MKNLIIGLAILLSANYVFAQKTWGFDPAHTEIQFKAIHLVITEVTGEFKNFDIKVVSKNEDFSDSNIEFSADVASLTTGIDKRDGHLKSDDFFNAEKYPKLTFKSKSFIKVADKKYKLKGDLTIRDVTKEVEFDAWFAGSGEAWGSTRAGFKISGKVSRFDYNLKWDASIESLGLVVSEDIEILCNVQLVEQK